MTDSLIWLDCETTGLDPRADNLLEVAAYRADFTNPFAPPYQDPICKFVLRNLDWDSVDARVLEMHMASGLVEECMRSKMSPEDVDQALCTSFTTGRTSESPLLVLAGSSVHFDLGFVRTWLPAFAKHLHYRVYDVSALKLFCLSMGMPEPEKTEPVHRAIADIVASVNIAKHCDAWLRTRS